MASGLFARCFTFGFMCFCVGVVLDYRLFWILRFGEFGCICVGVCMVRLCFAE